jgi:hypothetical protein
MPNNLQRRGAERKGLEQLAWSHRLRYN